MLPCLIYKFDPLGIIFVYLNLSVRDNTSGTIQDGLTSYCSFQQSHLSILMIRIVWGSAHCCLDLLPVGTNCPLISVAHSFINVFCKLERKVCDWMVFLQHCKWSDLYSIHHLHSAVHSPLTHQWEVCHWNILLPSLVWSKEKLRLSSQVYFVLFKGQLCVCICVCLCT